MELYWVHDFWIVPYSILVSSFFLKICEFGIIQEVFIFIWFCSFIFPICWKKYDGSLPERAYINGKTHGIFKLVTRWTVVDEHGIKFVFSCRCSYILNSSIGPKQYKANILLNQHFSNFTSFKVQTHNI